MTTTSIALDGYDVVQTHGVVRGIVVRSRSVFGQVGVKFQTFFRRQHPRSSRAVRDDAR